MMFWQFAAVGVFPAGISGAFLYWNYGMAVVQNTENTNLFLHNSAPELISAKDLCCWWKACQSVIKHFKWLTIGNVRDLCYKNNH